MNVNILKLLSLLFVLALAFVSCEDELVKSDYDYVMNSADSPKDVVTVGVSDTSVVSVSVSGTVSKDSTLTDWGVMYYTASMLESGKFLVTTAKDSKYNFSFKVSLSGLVPNTNYYCKTYAVNKDGITYGEQKTFKTKPAKALPFEIKATDALAT